MKTRTLIRITAMTLFAALAIPVGLAAQEQQPQHARLQHYKLTILDATLGGIFGEAWALNNKEWVVGHSTLPGDNTYHEALGETV